MELIEIIKQKLESSFPETELKFVSEKGEFSITVKKEKIKEVCRFLKNDEELSFILLDDLTAIDWAEGEERFTVVYHITSMKNKFRLRLKSNVKESDSSIDTVSDIWSTANWHEREVYDMFGIKFNGHPDLRRMYMPEDFQYHPLRKEFPVMGIPGSNPLPKK